MAFRRLAALEQRLGARLFERQAGHYAATAAGEALAEAGRFQRAPLAGQPWIALDDSAAGSKALQWLARQLPLELVAWRFSGLLMVRAACAQGLGLAVLPCFLGDTDSALVRLGPPLAECDSELWLLSHPELRETARVKAARDWLRKSLSSQAALLAGDRPGA